MKLSFYGAARRVTGSMFLLELDDDYRILIDCGSSLNDSRERKSAKEFGNFPFDASLINVVFLTHAHIDHSGQIPNLYQAGFEGQILCTSPTIDLTELLLYDAASLNTRIAKGIEKSHKKSKKWKSIETQSLYFDKQVKNAIGNFVPIAYNQRFRFKDDGYVTFIQAGHLLGAAHILIEIKENGVWKKIGFSGDIGRRDFTLLPNPQSLPDVDYLVMESTYGNRNHKDKGEPEAILKEIIEEACVDKAGRLIIPSFSVGRTQCLLYTLNKLYENYNIKPIKVFTDSPLAKNSTKVYEKYRTYLNKDAKEFYEETDSLFDFANLEYIETSADSQAISTHAEPCIIISSSGMIKGGRVEHHIEKNIENPYATILMVGYATDDSVGGKLLSGEMKNIIIRNKKLDVNARIRKIDIFSGHGGLSDLENFARQQSPEKLKKVFLVHGDLDAMINFRQILLEDGFSDVEIPEENQTYEL
ncbi:MAG: MBL fold metallo-hydrolase [Cytophagaceae bacterium]|nr:MBL fold metallo-hydrolase [Cytophagaceae bacterium]MBK9510372.1 MBL fold metallo-hydrolase [Cytophagaceae bacterium]MBK9936031.1 MBL fold metallo-hydrolase [Cytophagaceae bacterium]MBL0304082.1 MBL fold metallo-hydrolase [Cytophagaceae bacterium]MBL0326891.1 MBL fold metallo-hydrolase [Cytophagaceae bacterium]